MKNLAEMVNLNLNRRQLTLIQAITQEPKFYRALWEIGGQGRNRTTDTRIFSREQDRLGLYISKSYRGVGCSICSTMQDCAQLVHAKLTQGLCAAVYLSNAVFCSRNFISHRLVAFKATSIHSAQDRHFLINVVVNSNFILATMLPVKPPDILLQGSLP